MPLGVMNKDNEELKEVLGKGTLENIVQGKGMLSLPFSRENL